MLLKCAPSALALNAVGNSAASLIALLATEEAFAQDAPVFLDYHDATPAFHRLLTNFLPFRRFRLVSLSLYDCRSRRPNLFELEPRYAAVWLNRSGPAQRFVQDVDSAGFQSRFDDLARAGFKPTIIAATTSPSGKHRFAAVFEKTSGPIPLTQHGLVRGDPEDSGTIEHWTQQARINGWRPTTLTVYGKTPNRALFAGVWEPDPDPNVKAPIAWHTDGLTETFEEYQERFDAQVTAWNRPAYVTVSPFVRYLSIFEDTQIGPWIARHGLTKADYGRQRAAFVRQGYFPLVVQGGGFGHSVRYAALFAKQDRLIERQLTLSDSEDLPQNNIDDVIDDMMMAYGIRQAALAVVHGTRLLFARGYTRAEPDYPLATATTFFRVASCSKVLTACTIMQMEEEGFLSLEDNIQDILHLTGPDSEDPTDDRFNTVTIGQALTIRSGLRYKWDDSDGPAVVRAFGTRLPATKLQIASYYVGQPDLMLRNPGEADPKNLFSDFAFLLLSLVIERIGEGAFSQLVRDRIGRPLGATRIRIGRALVSEQASNEARYHDDELKLGRSVMSDDRPLVPFQYGGFNVRVGGAAGGLSVAAVDFARVLAALNLRLGNPILRPHSIDTMLECFLGWDFPHGADTGRGNFHRVKGGLLDGLQSVLNFTQGDAFSYVLYWAKDGLPHRDDRPPDPDRNWYPEFPPLRDAIALTLDPTRDRDRFPDFGMESF